MKRAPCLVVLMSIVCTVFSLASVPKASASLRCESIFTSSTLSLSENKLQDAIDTIAVYKHKIVNKSVGLTNKDLSRYTEIMSSIVESYFSSAKISYKVIETHIDSGILTKNSEPSFTYKTYEISGQPDGSSASRLLYGIGHSKFSNTESLKIYVDPLLDLVGDTKGFYSAKDKAIVVGLKALYLESRGVANTLRHEIQHYLEQRKLSKGHMTNARITFKDGKLGEKLAYGESFFLDEINTHIRDIRNILSFSNIRKLDKNNRALSIKQAALNADVRKSVLIKKYQILRRLLDQSASGFQQLALKTQVDSIISDGVGSGRVKFNLDKHNYRIIEVDLGYTFTGKLDDYNKTEINRVARSIIVNAYESTMKIDQELQRLKPRIEHMVGEELR